MIMGELIVISMLYIHFINIYCLQYPFDCLQLKFFLNMKNFIKLKNEMICINGKTTMHSFAINCSIH